MDNGISPSSTFQNRSAAGTAGVRGIAVAPRHGRHQHSAMKKRHDKNEFEAADDDLRTAEPPAPEPDATGVEGSDAMSDVDSTVGGGVVGGVQQLLAEQQDRYLRLAAEYDNYRKRTARE